MRTRPPAQRGRRSRSFQPSPARGATPAPSAAVSSWGCAVSRSLIAVCVRAVCARLRAEDEQIFSYLSKQVSE